MMNVGTVISCSLDRLIFSNLYRHRNSHTFCIHRLVQVVLRESMEPIMQKQWIERVIRAVNAAFPEDPPVLEPVVLQAVLEKRDGLIRSIDRIRRFVV